MFIANSATTFSRPRRCDRKWFHSYKHFAPTERILVHAVGLEPTEFTSERLIYSQVRLPLRHACLRNGLGFLVLGLCAHQPKTSKT